MIVLYDDARARTFEPFATTRPLGEVRAGALLVRERWEFVLPAKTGGFVSSPHLAGFSEFDAPPAHDGSVPAGTWLVNTRALPRLAPCTSEASVLAIDGQVAAVRLAVAVPAEQLRDPLFCLDDVAPGTGTMAHVPGQWLHQVWDLVGSLQQLLVQDIPVISDMIGATAMTMEALSSRGIHLTGEHALLIEPGAVVEPMTMFDTTAGPVLLRAGSQFQAFTRVIGPCYVGRHSTVMGDRISGCAIGDVCRVHGEVSSTIFIGHANKGHDGFVGHSVIGRWANLGAGTITSNLKNTYGTVSLWTPDGIRDTGMQFLGTLFGDHAKTGIGTRLTTGCVFGAGANVFNAMPPKVVAPFSWGDGAPYGVFGVGKFVETAAKMMARRDVTLSDDARSWWRQVHGVASADPRWSRS